MSDTRLDRMLTAAASLTSRVAPFTPIPVTGDEVTIFIHGYKGSFLHTPNGERAWVSPETVITRGKKTLALPFEGQQDTPRFEELQPGLPMTALTLIPRLIDIDFYLPWLQVGVRELPGFSFFTYDWRQDIRTSARQLAEHIDRLAAERSGRLRVNLIGHSMGGLVSLHLLRYGSNGERWSGAKYVRRVVFVAVPFRGAPAVFDDLLLGTATGRNVALLSREALFTFPAAFQLLSDDDAIFVNESGRPEKVDISSVETWRDQGWSVLGHPKWRDNADYLRQLGAMLEARRASHQALQDGLTDWPDSVEALTIIGRGRPSPARWLWKKDHVALKRSIDEDGDGDVLTSRAQPLPGMRSETYETSVAHAFILNDRDVQRRVLEFLR